MAVFPENLPTWHRPWTQNKTRDQDPKGSTVMEQLQDELAAAMQAIGTEGVAEITDGSLGAMFQPWKSFTSGMYFPSTPSGGSGIPAELARYKLIGKTCLFQAQWNTGGQAMGAPTANRPQFSLPFSPRNTATNPVGSAAYFMVDLTFRPGAWMSVFGNVSAQLFRDPDMEAVGVSRVHVSGAYEIQ